MIDRISDSRDDTVPENISNDDADMDNREHANSSQTKPDKSNSDSQKPTNSGPGAGNSAIASVFGAIRNIFFNSLTKRIIFLNMTALAALLATILYMNQFRQGLIDAKIESLLTQGRIIAGAIAGSITANDELFIIDPEEFVSPGTNNSFDQRLDPADNLRYPINPERIAPVLRSLVSPTKTRARIYDPDGILILDSRHLYAGGDILRQPGKNSDSTDFSWVRFIGNTLNKLLSQDDLPLHKEIVGPGTLYPEVQSALTGAPRPVVRQTKKGELTVSVALPIQRYRIVSGVILLSTEGDDIDKIVREERIEILRIFLVAAIVMLILSILLAGTIASPLQRLSDAAIRVKRGVKSRVEIPDFSNRKDEIGHLAGSISEMTDALYQRIEAIERFAADVSHELKNPLTSLRSAVETLPLVKNEGSRDRLLEVIQHDVKRLDRLITDISDASRLDADLARDHIETLDFEALVRHVVNASQEIAAREKNAKIELEVIRKGAVRKGFPVSGHDMRLGQVLNNLLDNAVSFIPHDSGIVSVVLKRDARQIYLTVKDNGPGIEAENFDRVFERFYTDRADRDGFGQNSGLGLSISRQIVEAHGGKISVENLTDGSSGAIFTVSIPAETKKI
ncbi:MAG: sensor histidine kinase [Pseudomonadota bacterium]